MELQEKDEKILQLIKLKGPLLPIHIVREIGWNTLLVGAALSDLSTKGLIKISHTKIGGSPVYYASGQEPKLQDLYKYLHEKEQRTYDLLKQKKVLRDKILEPVIRVALRNIKDFAKPLDVTVKEGSEIFWKWYLINNAEAESLIKEILKGELPQEKKTEEKVKEIKQDLTKEISKKEKEPKEVEKQENLAVKEEILEAESPFLSKINNYFEKNNVKIIEKKIIRKASEAEFLIDVTSSIGKVRYYCKAHSKKKYTDSDLSNIYVQGEIKKLPVLFLVTGDLTKKAQSLLEQQFKNLTIKKV